MSRRRRAHCPEQRARAPGAHVTGGYGPLLDAVRGVRWPARRPVGAALPGAHRSRQRGSSGEFTEYRLYRQGDDPKQLDWKLLGRSDRAFVRLTDDRNIVATWVLVDGSRSMAYPDEASALPASPPNKWSVARSLAVALAAVAHASSDPVGMLAVSEGGVTRLGARARRGAVADIARTLDALTCGGDRDIASLLSAAPPQARIVVITDLLGDLDVQVRLAAQRTAAGGIVDCVHVVAAEEVTLPAGAYLARDPEAPDVERVLTASVHVDYAARFLAFREEAARRWLAAGAGYTEARTDMALPQLVRRIVAGVGSLGASVPARER